MLNKKELVTQTLTPQNVVYQKLRQNNQKKTLKEKKKEDFLKQNKIIWTVT